METQNTIIVSPGQQLTASEWVVRNLAAHIGVWLALSKSGIRQRVESLAAGRASVVDLSEASAAEMRELRMAAEGSRGTVRPPKRWAEPASATEFIAAFDAFLAMLRADRRVSNEYGSQ